MRPIRLVMTAFGPYADRTVLEMDKLGEKGLYLICGETGSGKTTVFDAICFALYGKASGKNRDPSMLRSKYADSKTLTEVELTFLYRGDVYYIKRSPTQEVRKQKGSGTTEKKGEVYLKLPDKRELFKANEVKNEIKNIMGVDVDQFRQISMIAQGDFYNLLFASTDERKEIFHELFRTEKYAVFQKKIKDMYSEVSKQHDEIVSSIIQYINGVACDDTSYEYSELKIIKESGMFSRAIDLIGAVIEKDRSIAEEYTKALKTIEAEKSSVIEALAKAEEYEKAQKELEAVKEKEKSIAKQIEEYESTVNNAENREVGELSELANKITLISDKLSSYDELEAKISEQSLTEKSVINSEKEKSKLESEKDSLSKNIEEKNKKRSELENAGVKKAEYERALVECNHSLSALELLNKEYDEVKKLYLKVKSAEAKLNSASEDADNKRKIYNDSHQLYIAEQAGIIAEELVVGKECPVCGSTEHPKPAVKSEGAPTKAQIESNRLASEEADRVQRDESEIVGAVKATYEARIKNAKDKSAELVGTDDLKAALPIVVEKIESINKDISSYERLIEEEKLKTDKKLRLDIELPALLEKINSLTDTINRLNSDISAHKAKMQALEEEVGNMKSKLEYESKSVATAELNKLRIAHATAKNEIDAVYKHYSDLRNNHSTLKGQREALTKQISEYSEIDIEKFGIRSEELEDEKLRIFELSKSVNARISVNQSAYSGVKSKNAEIIKVERKLTDLDSLYRTASGNLNGREKIDFETFIQAYYFEHVIASANRRFNIMTDGVYQLVRRIDCTGDRGKTGLDLNIKQRGSNEERSVKSLSGGESFEASLALALGLSDVIQSAAGGIKLDTMFVDEGFGTLSDKHLERSLKALESLSDGNRLVGIISHVGYLNESIDRKIIVKKTSDGTSTATIVTD